MGNYQLELLQNNEILSKNHHDSSGFVIEFHVLRRIDRLSRTKNRTYYQEKQVLLSETGMKDFLISTLSEEQMLVNTGDFLFDNGVRHLRDTQFGVSLPLPIYSFRYLVRSVLGVVWRISNNPTNQSLKLVPIQMNLVIDEFRFLQLSDFPIVFQRLNDSEIAEGQSSKVGLQPYTAVKILKEEKVEADTDCAICFERVGAGEFAVRLPCYHLFHTGCATGWLNKKPSCPLCRAKAF